MSIIALEFVHASASCTSPSSALTRLIEHLVALIEDENADLAKSKVLIAGESPKTTRSTNDNMGACVLALQDLNILLDGSATVEDTGLDIRKILAEAVVLIANLVGQLTGVAHDNNRNLAIDGLNLLKRGENEDSSLSETGLRLAENICSKQCLRDDTLLNCRSRER
jgi:hypothetical protein